MSQQPQEGLLAANHMSPMLQKLSSQLAGFKQIAFITFHCNGEYEDHRLQSFSMQISIFLTVSTGQHFLAHVTFVPSDACVSKTSCCCTLCPSTHCQFQHVRTKTFSFRIASFAFCSKIEWGTTKQSHLRMPCLAGAFVWMLDICV